MKPTTLISIGRSFFAIALVGLGVEHFIFQEFVIGRAPAWPVGLPGSVLFAYGAGVIVIVAAASIMTRRLGRQMMFALALLVFVWALLRHLPIVAADVLLGGSWTRMGKALTFVGGLLAVAGTLPRIDSAAERKFWNYANVTRPLVRIGAICLGCFLTVSGLQHFKFTSFVTTLIPVWMPGNHTWWVWFAGVALLSGGVGLLITRTTRLAALMSGLMIFSWVWIVHLPRVFVSVSDGIAVFEALAFSGLGLLVAGALAEG